MRIKKQVVYLQRLKRTTVHKCTAVLEPPAGVVKLVDTPDLGSGAARCVGSSPITRTKASSKEEAFLLG